MAGENAQVDVYVRAEDSQFLAQMRVNGYNLSSVIYTESIDDAEKVASSLRRLLREVYRIAYRDGFFSCQKSIQDALGLRQE